MRWLALVIGLWPTLALADGHFSTVPPFLTEVRGVSSDDVLNLRRTPDHRSDKIGSLAHDATGVEVTALSDDTRWVQVNSGETSGWVRSRYLGQTSAAPWHSFETGLSCFGTEPFWSADIAAHAEAISFQSMDQSEHGFTVDWTSGLSGRLPTDIGMGGDGVSAMILATACNDGMSDRNHALRIRLFLHDTAGFDGCCSLAR